MCADVGIAVPNMERVPMAVSVTVSVSVDVVMWSVAGEDVCQASVAAATTGVMISDQ